AAVPAASRLRAAALRCGRPAARAARGVRLGDPHAQGPGGLGARGSARAAHRAARAGSHAALRRRCLTAPRAASPGALEERNLRALDHGLAALAGLALAPVAAGALALRPAWRVGLRERLGAL